MLNLITERKQSFKTRFISLRTNLYAVIYRYDIVVLFVENDDCSGGGCGF